MSIFCDITPDHNILHFSTASLIEYPFAIRLVRIQTGAISICTVGLDNPRFKSDSLVAEWNNQWVAGKDADRQFTMTMNLATMQ